MSMSHNYNDAELQGINIPKGSIVKVINNIKWGHGPDGVTCSRSSDSQYLKCELTVTEGPHCRKKVFHNIGTKGSVRNGVDVFRNMGRSDIRAILESSRGITPNDDSDRAKQARCINSYQDLDGMEFLIKTGEDLEFQKVTVASIITPGNPAYDEYYKGNGVSAGAPAQPVQNPAEQAQAAPPQPSAPWESQPVDPQPAAPQSNVPSWANQ